MDSTATGDRSKNMSSKTKLLLLPPPPLLKEGRREDEEEEDEKEKRCLWPKGGFRRNRRARWHDYQTMAVGAVGSEKRGTTWGRRRRRRRRWQR